MTTHPPNNTTDYGFQTGMICCACNEELKGGGMRFPKSPELRSAWVNIIMEKTPYYPGKENVLEGIGLCLCINHFDENTIIKKKEGDSEILALKRGGIPTIFDNVQKQNNGDVIDVHSTNPHLDDEILICYENTTDVKSKEDLSSDIILVDATENSVPIGEKDSIDQVVTNSLNESDTLVTDPTVSNNDLIPSVQEFMSLLRLKDAHYYKPWRVLYNESSVLFTLFDEDCKYLIQSVTVDKNLKVSVFFHGQPFSGDSVSKLLGEDLKLDTWTKFKKLVLFLHTMTEDKEHHAMQLKHACHLLEKCIETGPQFHCTQKEIKRWKFLLDQIKSSTGENQSYSAENLEWAIHAYSVNRLGYSKIYQSDVLTLPHPATLELLKRQTVETARRQVRPKVLIKKPVTPPISGIGNGLSPSTSASNGSPLQYKPIQIVSSVSLSSSNVLTSTNPTNSTRQNGFPTSNRTAVIDIDYSTPEV